MIWRIFFGNRDPNLDSITLHLKYSGFSTFLPVLSSYFFCECCWVFFFCSLNFFWKKACYSWRKSPFIPCVPRHQPWWEPRCGSAAETPNCLLVGRLGALTLKLMVCMGEFWNMEPPESSGKKSPGFMLISNYHVYIYECTYRCRILLTPTGDTCSFPFRFFFTLLEVVGQDVGRGLLPPQV